MVLVLLYTVVAYRISPDIHFPSHGRGGNRLSLAAVAPLIVGQAYIVRLGDSCLRMFSLLCKLSYRFIFDLSRSSLLFLLLRIQHGFMSLLLEASRLPSMAFHPTVLAI